MKSTVLLFAIALFMSCSSTKNTKETEAMDKSQTSVKDQKMMDKGFLKGTIVVSTEQGECPYTIKVTAEEGTYFLDPINLEDPFKNDGQRIWFTYNGLRMMNRCDNASPISIKEIQKRAE